MKTINPRENFEKLILEKAMKDAAFRSQLIENPREAIQSLTKIMLPDSLKIHVLEEDAGQFYLVLPAATATSDRELSEAELLAVQGGFDYSIATDCGSCGNDNCFNPS